MRAAGTQPRLSGRHESWTGTRGGRAERVTVAGVPSASRWRACQLTETIGLPSVPVTTIAPMSALPIVPSGPLLPPSVPTDSEIRESSDASPEKDIVYAHGTRRTIQ